MREVSSNIRSLTADEVKEQVNAYRNGIILDGKYNRSTEEERSHAAHMGRRCFRRRNHQGVAEGPRAHVDSPTNVRTPGINLLLHT